VKNISSLFYCMLFERMPPLYNSQQLGLCIQKPKYIGIIATLWYTGVTGATGSSYYHFDLLVNKTIQIISYMTKYI